MVFPHTPASREMLTANTEPTELLKIMMAQTQMTLDSYNISVSRRAESVTTEQEAADFLAEARRKLALINKAAHQ